MIMFKIYNIINIIMSYNDESFVLQTMLTCIGNKRKLVNNILDIVKEVSTLVSKDKLNIVDGFAGSSVVSRKLSCISDNIYINDLELYSYLMAKCYMKTPSDENKIKIKHHIDTMNEIAKNGPYIEGFISELYAPKDTEDVQEGERCFYTRENALIIDTLRNYIEENVDDELSVYCLVPLLNKASIHTNTAGVFKGFYKDGKIGCFGGAGKNALTRIMSNIELEMPIWSNYSFNANCYNKDINDFIKELPDDIDLIYLDPPYNQHPYGSNYFMLNLIANNEKPTTISKVSGIPADWNRSNYNKHKEALISMKDLMADGLEKSKYLLLSYNNEGIIKPEEWEELFKDYNIKKYEIKYDTYKGSRNLKQRSNKVIEIMYLVSL